MSGELTLSMAGAEPIRARVADSFWSRGVGLLGRRSLPPAEGLLIRPCSSVHTLFMRFTIDVVYLDEAWRVVKVVHRLKPWRFSAGRGAKMVLELQGGEAERIGIADGAVLERTDER